MSLVCRILPTTNFLFCKLKIKWQQMSNAWRNACQCKDSINAVVTFNSKHLKKKDFIYLFMRDTQRERQRHRRIKLMAPPTIGRLGSLTCVWYLLSFYIHTCTYKLSALNQGSDWSVILIRKCLLRAARVAQWFSAVFSPGPDTGDLGLSPMLCSLRGACFSLLLCLCLSLCVSLMNK